MNTLYIYKHGYTDQLYTKNNPLSLRGKRQSILLYNYLVDKDISKIFSGEKRRAYDSVLVLSKGIDIQIITDNRLNDKINCIPDDTEYLNYISDCFSDYEYKSTNEESLNQVKARISSFIKETLICQEENIVLSTHGICLAFIVEFFMNWNTFNIWKNTNPGDLFKICFGPNKVRAQKVKY